MKKLNNKGFSLVELIIVIAIMVILVAVLSPQFTKWVEKARVSTDISTASELASAIQVEMAAGNIDTSIAATTVTETWMSGKDSFKGMSAPKSKASCVGKGKSFVVKIVDSALYIYVDSEDDDNQIYPEKAGSKYAEASK